MIRRDDSDIDDSDIDDSDIDDSDIDDGETTRTAGSDGEWEIVTRITQ